MLSSGRNKVDQTRSTTELILTMIGVTVCDIAFAFPNLNPPCMHKKNKDGLYAETSAFVRSE